MLLIFSKSNYLFVLLIKQIGVFYPTLHIKLELHVFSLTYLHGQVIQGRFIENNCLISLVLILVLNSIGYRFREGVMTAAVVSPADEVSRLFSVQLVTRVSGARAGRAVHSLQLEIIVNEKKNIKKNFY